MWSAHGDLWTIPGEESSETVTVSVTVEVGKEGQGESQEEDWRGESQEASDNEITSSSTTPAKEEGVSEPEDKLDGSSEKQEEVKEVGDKSPEKEEKQEDKDVMECIKKEVASEDAEREEERNGYSQQLSKPEENSEKAPSGKQVEGEVQEVEEISAKSGKKV